MTPKTESRSTSKGRPVGIAVNDLAGRFLLVNRAYCDITGYSEQELESRTFQSITHPDDLDSNSRLARRMFSGEVSSIVYEKRYVRKDSRIVWVRNTVSMMHDGEGNPRRAVAVAEPIPPVQTSGRSSASPARGFRLISKSLHRVVEEERRRIARDLHDSTGQLLTGLVMTLTRLQKPGCEPEQTGRLVAEALELAHQCSREVRTLSYLLHPPLLEEFGLANALHSFGEGFSQRTGIDLKLVVPDDFGRLPRDLEMAIFRLVQEGLTNIHRHSGSSLAAITLERRLRQVVLEVLDFGCGLSGRSIGVGLAGMRERAQLAGGDLTIRSSREGTRITVVLPLSVSDEKEAYPDRRRSSGRPEGRSRHSG